MGRCDATSSRRSAARGVLRTSWRSSAAPRRSTATLAPSRRRHAEVPGCRTRGRVAVRESGSTRPMGAGCVSGEEVFSDVARHRVGGLVHVAVRVANADRNAAVIIMVACRSLPVMEVEVEPAREMGSGRKWRAVRLAEPEGCAARNVARHERHDGRLRRDSSHSHLRARIQRRSTCTEAVPLRMLT
jgi:hypothetical protein